MNWNHVCLMLGALFVVLGMTVFAHATAITLDCVSPFKCSYDGYCITDQNGPQGLEVGYSGCGQGGSEPCTYDFSSTTTGAHSCKVTIGLSDFGHHGTDPSQNQPNEVTEMYINGTLIGKTIDKYANPSDPTGTTFCGEDKQTFTKQVTLNKTNQIRFNSYQSHTITSVLISCTLTGPDCSLDLAPTITQIPTKSISYNSQFSVDLWDFIDDKDYDALTDLNISASVSGNSVSCTLANQRFLNCKSGMNLGTSVVTISARDPCGLNTSRSFNVNVSNQPPYLSIPDTTVSCVTNMTRFIDLQSLAWDENKADLNFSIAAQTNPALVGCRVDGNRYLSCDINSCAVNYSDISVTVRDIFGLTYTDTFRLNVTNFPPYWIKQLPVGLCINDTNTRLVNLTNYTYDVEDTNVKLKYSLISQTNKNAANCYIDGNYLACNNISNLASSNLLAIRVTDTNGLYADATMTINTNCSRDKNGTDQNITFSSINKGICMEKCAQNSTPITLANNTDTRKCFNFLVDSNPSEINPLLSISNICLNAGESTTLYLNANTCGAASYNNYVTQVYDRDNNLSLTFNYSIGSCNNFDGFSLDEVDTTVCQGQTRDFSVRVTNTSSDTKTIPLIADNSTLLPFFTRNQVTLNSGESKLTTLTVNAKYAPLGMQRIVLHGATDNYAIDKKLDLEVIDCSNIIPRTFVITTTNFCYDVSRGQTFDGTFSVKCVAKGDDCSLFKKKVALQLTGIEGELSYSLLEMQCSEEKKVDYTVKVPDNAPAGKFYFNVTGTEQPSGPYDETQKYSESKLLCFNIAGESSAGITINTQSKDIPSCGSAIFELEINNTGDFDENFTLSARNLPTGVTALFSEPFVTVSKKSSKVVYVSVGTNTDTPIQDNQFLQVVLSGRISLTANIYFNVKASSASDDLEILSATKAITMNAKTSEQYAIIIRNNSGNTLKNIAVTFENVPKDVNMESVTVAELANGDTTTVVGTISAGDVNGVFTPSFIVSAGNIVNKSPLTLTIQGRGSNGIFSGLFGLFGFNGLSGDLIVAGAAAIFLILLIAIVILGIAAVAEPVKKENWVE